jgi:hypothetical protein
LPNSQDFAREYALSSPPLRFKIASDFPDFQHNIRTEWPPPLPIMRESYQSNDPFSFFLAEMSGVIVAGKMALSFLDNLGRYGYLAGLREISHDSAD